MSNVKRQMFRMSEMSNIKCQKGKKCQTMLKQVKYQISKKSNVKCQNFEHVEHFQNEKCQTWQKCQTGQVSNEKCQICQHVKCQTSDVNSVKCQMPNVKNVKNVKGQMPNVVVTNVTNQYKCNNSYTE